MLHRCLFILCPVPILLGMGCEFGSACISPERENSLLFQGFFNADGEFTSEIPANTALSVAALQDQPVDGYCEAIPEVLGLRVQIHNPRTVIIYDELVVWDEESLTLETFEFILTEPGIHSVLLHTVYDDDVETAGGFWTLNVTF